MLESVHTVGGNGVKLGSAGVEEVHNATEKFCLYIFMLMVYVVTLNWKS
jgi:hypothetical protein